MVDLSDEPVLGPRERLPAREPRARARAAVRRAGLPLRPAGARAVPAAVAVDRRHRQARRQDRRHRPRRAAARARPRRRRRRDGPRRPARAGGRRGAADARATCSSSRAAGGMRPPTTSRRPRSPASSRSAAAAAAAASPARPATRTCSQGAALAAEREPGARDLRRQRRGDPAGRDRRARARRRARRRPRGRDRLPERLPDPRLRPRGRHRRARRGAGRRDPRGQGAAGRLGRAAAAAGRAGARPARRVLHDGAAGRARAIERHLREEHGAEVVLVSGNLARREALREDLARARDAEVYLVEIKAAAIDVVAEEARRARGRRSCSPTTSSSRVGVPDLDTELIRLADQAIAREAVAAMTDRRHRRPLPLGGEDGLPFSKGLMARALTATGISADRAYELALAAEADIAHERPRVDLVRAARRARAREARRGGRRDDDAPAAPLPGALRPRPADHPARRRRDRHGQVDRRDRRRLPARDHARHLDRLRPPDDARLLLARVHAGDPLLELRGRPRDRRRGRRGQRGACSTASSSRRATCSSASRPRSTARSRRAGRWCSRASTSSPGCCRARSEGALVVQCVLAINDAEAHASHFWIRDTRLRGRAAVREVPRRVRRHPPGAGVHPGTREEARRAR